MVTYNDNRQYGEHDFKGLSTDTKPINCAINSLFLELDTGDFYYYDGQDPDPWKKIGGEE